ncbi:fe(3+) dicitrate transport protein FecA [Klebsiella pneumoniae]|uniref:Fe(3+) dicitrate transport protein FecA n=1 Tax=Klebsiella pneumoniae TaxID=573 RepID=A0A2X3E2D6_KLEPN|nr:fe(3+) dicitrate transport protein FecA [Klebsiella pneumoniae]
MDAIDVVRGGGAVRYGPQSVGGVVNFVTRTIPQDFGIEAGVEGQLSPTSSQNNPKETHNLMVGGTADNGFGTALLYSGTRGSDWREHSATRIDDLMLKSKYAPNEVHTFNSLLQYYDGEADMPGGLFSRGLQRRPLAVHAPLRSFLGASQAGKPRLSVPAGQPA